MNFSIRIFFILPIIFFTIITLTQLLVGNFLAFTLWSFVALVAILICWPIVTKATMKYVPVYQIFSLFGGFLLLMIIFSFFDIDQFTSLTKDKVTILSVFSGISLTIILLFIHGQRGNG